MRKSLLVPVLFLTGCGESPEIDPHIYGIAEFICEHHGGIARYYQAAVACKDGYFTELKMKDSYVPQSKAKEK